MARSEDGQRECRIGAEYAAEVGRRVLHLNVQLGANLHGVNCLHASHGVSFKTSCSEVSSPSSIMVFGYYIN